MIHETIYLTQDKNVTLTTYILDRSQQIWDNVGQWQPEARPAVLILPGGAYHYCSDREAEPVAMPFLNAGFNAFVLRYSVGEASAYPAPLEDVSRAVWEIRRRAAEWCINPNQIAVGGFSAGGSLTTMLGTQWNTPGLAERLGIPEGGNRPDAIFPCYALTSIEEGMLKHPEGVETTPPGAILEQKTPQLNTSRHVGPHTPPVFMWHTAEDELLSANGPIEFVQACLQHKVPVEFHLYQHGRHGASINTDLSSYGQEQPVNVNSWVPLCISWLRALFCF